MKSVKMDLSLAQIQKLRNGHTIRLTPKMLGSGSDIIVDPVTYDNINRHMARNKGILFSLDSETIKQNMEGGSILQGLKNSYAKLPEPVKKEVRRNVKRTAKTALKRGVDTGIVALASNPYTAPVAPMAEMAYQYYDGDKKIDKFVNSAVKKSGLGLKLSNGAGLRAGSGMYLSSNRGEGLYGGSCPHCGNGNELFLLDQQNTNKKLKNRKIQM
jgi:hypothetical protein